MAFTGSDKSLHLDYLTDPQGGRRKTARWFVPAGKGDFEQELPAEWEGWFIFTFF